MHYLIALCIICLHYYVLFACVIMRYLLALSCIICLCYYVLFACVIMCYLLVLLGVICLCFMHYLLVLLCLICFHCYALFACILMRYLLALFCIIFFRYYALFPCVKMLFLWLAHFSSLSNINNLSLIPVCFQLSTYSRRKRYHCGRTVAVVGSREQLCECAYLTKMSLYAIAQTQG